jgi:hypothetical protein
MKISDLHESRTDEFTNPFSKKSRDLKKYQKAGAKDLQATADNLGNEFASYLGTQGKKLSRADYTDLSAFLGQKGVDTNRIDTSIPFSRKRMDQIFGKLAKDAMTKQSAPKTSAGSGSQQANTAPKGQKAPPAKASSAYVSTKDAALKLNAKEKRRLISQLQKSLPQSKQSKETVVDRNFDRNQKLSQYGKVGR